MKTRRTGSVLFAVSGAALGLAALAGCDKTEWQIDLDASPAGSGVEPAPQDEQTEPAAAPTDTLVWAEPGVDGAVPGRG